MNKTEHAHDTRTPDWQVLIVAEKDCRGPSSDPSFVPFAYTVGLHERHGLSELHLAARAVKDRAGAGTLGPLSLGMILNTIAADMIDGLIAPGDFHRETSGGGRVVLTFLVGEPGEREPLEAFQTHDDASVIPVTWTTDLTPVP